MSKGRAAAPGKKPSTRVPRRGAPGAPAPRRRCGWPGGRTWCRPGPPVDRRTRTRCRLRSGRRSSADSSKKSLRMKTSSGAQPSIRTLPARGEARTAESKAQESCPKHKVVSQPQQNTRPPIPPHHCDPAGSPSFSAALCSELGKVIDSREDFKFYRILVPDRPETVRDDPIELVTRCEKFVEIPIERS